MDRKIKLVKKLNFFLMERKKFLKVKKMKVEKAQNVID